MQVVAHALQPKGYASPFFVFDSPVESHAPAS